MSLRTRRVKKAFGFDKTEAQKYVLVPDRATTVSFEHLCAVASRSTTLSLEVIRLVTGALAFAMRTFIQEGHPVQIEGIGTFTPSFSAKSQVVEEEANLASIRAVRINYLPAVALKVALNQMGFVFDKTDSTQDATTTPDPGTTNPDSGATEPEPDIPEVV